MAKDNLHSNHRERLRTRYFKEGIDSFESHQILELILFYSIPRKDTNNIAHELLNRFGSLSGVFEAPVGELTMVKGVGKATAVYLNLFSQIVRKYEEDKKRDKKDLSSSFDACEYCVGLFKGRIYECMFVICMDSQNKIIGYEKVAEGTINEATVYPRSIIRAALSNNAAKVIITHNHPGGTTTPSTEDLSITTKIEKALSAIDIKLCDHIIVAGDDCASCMK